MIIRIVHISEQSFFFNQIRFCNDHNIMRDRCFGFVLRNLSLFNCFINYVENEVNLIGGRSKKANLFIVAPNMWYILKIFKSMCLFSTNQVFVVLENTQLAALEGRAKFGFWEKFDDTHTVVRIATSWATRMDEVEALIDLM